MTDVMLWRDGEEEEEGEGWGKDSSIMDGRMIDVLVEHNNCIYQLKEHSNIVTPPSSHTPSRTHILQFFAFLFKPDSEEHAVKSLW